MTSTETQLQAVLAAARFWSGSQSGPRPGSKEALFLAGLLRDAAETLKRYAGKGSGT